MHLHVREAAENLEEAQADITRRVVVIARKETEEGDAVASRALGSPLHGTTLKGGTVAQADKLRQKRGLKPADFSPSWDRRGCPSQGLGGLSPAEAQGCPPEAHRAAACSPARLSRGQGRPPKCHQRHLGPEGRGVAIFPSCPLEEKDVFLCCLAFVLKMSSESLGGRGELCSALFHDYRNPFKTHTTNTATASNASFTRADLRV
ncbi:uncharacterized protein ACIBXB_009103 isoform 1-T3 [Morphnus guianensis]